MFNFDDPESSNQVLLKAYKSICEEFIPYISVEDRKRRDPWVNSETAEAIRLKQTLFRSALGRRQDDPVRSRNLNTSCKKVKRLFTSSIAEYEQRLVIDANKNTKKLFGYVRLKQASNQSNSTWPSVKLCT